MTLSTLTIDRHASVQDEALRQTSIAALQANRIDPKSLYVTPHQADLWRQVFLRHAPLHGNAEFARIYQEAFDRVLDQFASRQIYLVGLGCGTGAKELAFYTKLKHRGQHALFSAIDVSRDLVVESAGKLVGAGAGHRRSLVCDLGQAAFLAEWLDGVDSGLPRLITFFGLVPNFAPSEVIRIFRALLRPSDLLLVSAHLAPVASDQPGAVAAAMDVVLPQYDNPETLAWLAVALAHERIEHRVDPPEMTIGAVEGIPAFLAQARWKTSEPFEKEGHSVSPNVEEPLRLFYSLRYTPALFENMLRDARLKVERLALTSCRQEALWSVQKR